MKASWAPLLLMVVLIVPAAGAESPAGGVNRCQEWCTPQDANEGAGLKHGKEPVNVILYPHFDGIQRAPLNTVEPADNAFDQNRGSVSPSVFLPGKVVQFRAERFVWWSTPGEVRYLEDGRAIPEHTEHGLADEVKIAGEKLTLFFYVSAHAVPGQSARDLNNVEAGVLPGLGLFAQVETGRHSFNSKSTVIAQGDTDDPGSRVHVVSLPNEDENVFEYKLELAVQNKIIPYIHDELKGGYVVTIIPYQLRGENWEYEATQADWRVRTGHAFLPRLVIPVEEPMRTVYSWMNVLNEKLYFRWTLVADVGSYDLNPDSIQLEVMGPQGKVDPKIVTFNYLRDWGTNHDLHFVPANQTWGIDYRKVPLADGDYVATGVAHNRQHTYELTQEWTFTVRNGVPDLSDYVAPPPPVGVAPPSQDSGEEKSADTPGLGLLGLGAAVAATISMVARRRKA